MWNWKNIESNKLKETRHSEVILVEYEGVIVIKYVMIHAY